jgi:para-aminobenzoate synthetase component I
MDDAKNSASIFLINNFETFKIQMLNWANQFNIFCLLDNQQYQFEKPAFECLLAVGCKNRIEANAGSAFSQLKNFSNLHPNKWLFGHFGYDLKNEIENLHSNHSDNIGFSDLFFFEPAFVLQLSTTQLIINADDKTATKIFTAIGNESNCIKKSEPTNFTILQKITKANYIKTIKKLLQHIAKGDCYEINFCQEFFVKNIEANAIELYHKLTTISPNPFSALYKLNDKFCVCASPERYLKKVGNTIFSQPIKGTSQRDFENSENDLYNKNYLSTNQKEKSENVMVVDLVRNDLSRICKQGSVKVDELFGVYSFPQVHQMISTISGQVADEVHWVDMVQKTFPMGSMTGAPKKKVMQLIETHEKTKRGLFSGAMGYVTPTGNFDFNVVIRSIFYNNTNKYLSFFAGSGITFNSHPEQEYEECLLKTEAIKKVLTNNF